MLPAQIRCLVVVFPQKMLRRALVRLAPTVSAGATKTGPLKKKRKWIDRRRKTVANGGKDVWIVGDMPSCALCHVRFKYKQDYAVHKESELHKAREKWVETTKWFRETGAPALASHQNAEWDWYCTTVLKPKAETESIDIEVLKRQVRQARIDEEPHCHGFLQPPAVRGELVEPRDNRWPYSSKW